jgi:adenylate cyclase
VEAPYRQVNERLDLPVHDLGPTQLKNIADSIRVYSLKVGQPAPVLAPEVRAQHLSIVVLPFATIGGEPEQEHFVDGVTEPHNRPLTDTTRLRDRPQHGVYLQR